MADDKKPNLKDRLKRTTAAAQPGGAPVAPSAGGVPPGAVPGAAAPIAPPVSAPMQSSGALPGIPGIPGLGGDVAPPAFVQQQQKQEAARQRAAAIAADPFSSSSAAAPQANEVRLVIDGAPVDDREVGRGRAGTIVAVLLTAIVGLGGGYAVGGLVADTQSGNRTKAAVTEVRNAVTTVGDTINAIKTHVDSAIEHGNIVVQREDSDSQAAAPTHAPEVDEELFTWFQAQPADPPFAPDVYSGRAIRLKTAVVGKLVVVQLEFNEAWRQLGVLTRMNVNSIRTSMNSVSPANNPVRGAVVAFTRPQADGPFFAQVVSSTVPNPQGLVTISGVGIPAAQTRTAYLSGPITELTLATFAFQLAPNQGLSPIIVSTAAAQWNLYRSRVSDLKQLVDQLVTNQGQLLDLLTGRSGS